MVLPCLVLVSLSGAVFAGQKDKQARLRPPVPAFTMTPGFAVKAADVTVPDGVPMGQYRRIVRPFRNWTQICDENLQEKKKICNITQAILGESGMTVLSWSLAATDTGQPFMIMRVPASVGADNHIQLDFRDGSAPIKTRIAACDRNVCISYLPVGPRMRAYIKKAATPEISYSLLNGQDAENIVFRAPLDGLAVALSAI